MFNSKHALHLKINYHTENCPVGAHSDTFFGGNINCVKTLTLIIYYQISFMKYLDSIYHKNLRLPPIYNVFK